MDVSGKILNSFPLKNVGTGSFSIDLNDFVNGMYFIQVTDGVSTVSKKIVLYR